MMRAACVLVASVACRPPALPPVPPSPPRAEPGVPSQARIWVLRAEVALDQGAHEAAVDAAGRAARFDRSAAAPQVLLARAQAAQGESAAARSAIDAAIALEPHALQPRWVRSQLIPAHPARSEDLARLAAAPTELPDRALSVLLSELPVQAAQSPGVREEARRRVFSATPDHLSAWLPSLSAEASGLAVVVAAVRLDRVGRADAEVQRAAVAVVRASGCDPGGWLPVPPVWLASSPRDAPGVEVGYERAPDDDRGWLAACAGDRVEAVHHLSRAWAHNPSDPTLHEQLWLVQRAGSTASGPSDGPRR